MRLVFVWLLSSEHFTLGVKYAKGTCGSDPCPTHVQHLLYCIHWPCLPVCKINAPASPSVRNTFGPASLRTSDYPAFWENIRENVRVRTRAYFSKAGQRGLFPLYPKREKRGLSPLARFKLPAPVLARKQHWFYCEYPLFASRLPAVLDNFDSNYAKNAKAANHEDKHT